NLWPEVGRWPNPKDKVENVLHRAVCDRRVSLAAAQHAIASDWLTAEARLGLRSPSPSPSPTPTPSRTPNPPPTPPPPPPPPRPSVPIPLADAHGTDPQLPCVHEQPDTVRLHHGLCPDHDRVLRRHLNNRPL